MPFLDDTGVRDERRGPRWAAFATLADQVERLVAVNVGWSLQLLPGVLALAFPAWPPVLRIALLVYTGLALVPATGALYGLAGRAVDGDLLSVDLAVATLRELALPSLRALAPLYGALGLVVGWAALPGASGTPALDTLAPLAALLLLTAAGYWGPLVAAEPDRPAWPVLRASARLVWRAPGSTLLTAGVVAGALVVGAVSVGGLFLVVPVLVALLQTHLFRSVASRQAPAAPRGRLAAD